MPEPKITYRKLDHKADSGFFVEAPSLERLYIHSALALTDMMVSLDTIKSDDERQTVAVEAEDRERLMVRWLNEILFHFEKNKFLCRRIVFDKFDGKKIKATLRGEHYDPIRHGHVSEIKAVTYHQLEIGEQTDPAPSFFAKVFLDL